MSLIYFMYDPPNKHRQCSFVEVFFNLDDMVKGYSEYFCKRMYFLVSINSINIIL